MKSTIRKPHWNQQLFMFFFNIHVKEKEINVFLLKYVVSLRHGIEYDYTFK